MPAIVTSVTAASGTDLYQENKRLMRRYGWSAAGALMLGLSAAVALGSGTAHADADPGNSAADGARSAGVSANSPARDSVQPRRSSATSSGNAAAARQASAQVRGADQVRSAVTSSQGSATFSLTGGSQTWAVPAGVQSAFVTAQGGFGGPCGITSCIDPYTPIALYPASIRATLSLSGGSSAPITALNVVVGGSGAGTDSRDPGAGGFGGGASGGSGSTFGQGGAGGGGATTVAIAAGGPAGAGTVLVAGGGGGYGGARYGNQGAGGPAGGGDSQQQQGSDGVWPGEAGSGAGGDNGGAGGAGGTQSGGNGSSGGDAEDLSGNAGGGGGGGGYLGGSGGQAGQSGVFGTAGGGGGGGGGSSYADPTLTTGVYTITAEDPDFGAPVNGSATIQWVDILTTALGPLKRGQSTNQQLVAIFGGDADSVNLNTWQVSAGALPPGLALSAAGALTGTPTRVANYSFQTTVSYQSFAQSVITYSGISCGRRCGYVLPRRFGWSY